MGLCNGTKSGAEGSMWEHGGGAVEKGEERETSQSGRARLETYPRQSLTGRHTMGKVKKCFVFVGV